MSALKLDIGNSYTSVTGISSTELKELKALLSYEVDGGYSANGIRRPHKVSLVDAHGRFPTGLLKVVMEDFVAVSKRRAQIQDLRIKPISADRAFEANFEHTPRLEQKQAVEAAVKAHRGIINAVTGSGKSLIAGMLIYRLQVRTLVVVPSLELKAQLSESFKAWFGEHAVGKDRPIYVENIQALDPRTPATGYDCVIIDEFHHSASKSYRDLNAKAWTGVYYRFGLSATPYRNQEEERLLLESILSDVIYTLDYKKAVSAGYVVPVEGYYIQVPIQKTNGYTWAEVYSDLVVNNKVRNEALAGLMRDLKLADKSTLTLVKEIAHGKLLSEMTGIPFANGKDAGSRELIERFSTGAISGLIGTSVVSEGVDTRACEYIIIAGLGKARSAFQQQIGRGLRKFGDKDSCKVILVKDSSHRWTINHFNAQKAILKTDYGVTLIKLD